jgi:hypothetical protein
MIALQRCSFLTLQLMRGLRAKWSNTYDNVVQKHFSIANTSNMVTTLKRRSSVLRRKRIVGVLYGVEKHEIAADDLMPVALKKIDSVDINSLESYFEQLEQRVTNWEQDNGKC